MISEAECILIKKSIGQCMPCGCDVSSGGEVCVNCHRFNETVERLIAKHFSVKYVPEMWMELTSYVLNQNFHSFTEGQALFKARNSHLLYALADGRYEFACRIGSAAFSRVVSVKQSL